MSKGGRSKDLAAFGFLVSGVAVELSGKQYTSPAREGICMMKKREKGRKRRAGDPNNALLKLAKTPPPAIRHHNAISCVAFAALPAESGVPAHA